MASSRTSVRTPRRRKVWMERHTFIDISSAAEGTERVLSSYMTSVGLSLAGQGGLTVVRTIGSLAICHGAVDAASAQWDWVRIGLAWAPTRVATAGGTDAQVPDPLQDSYRQTRWVQEWLLGAFTKTSGTTGGFEIANATGPEGLSWTRFDVSQMAKQSQPTDQLILRWKTAGNWTTATSMYLRIDMSFLVALP